MAINTTTLSAILCGLLLIGCAPAKEESSFSEGTIVYDVTFPFQKDDILVNLYPSEMVMDFKDSESHMSLQSLGGIVATEFVVNNNTKEFCQILRAFKDRHMMVLNEGEVEDMVSSMPRMILTPTEDTDSLAGYLCKKTIAIFNNDSVPPIELWHTDEIDIKTPNWCNQFYDCDEVLLGYEIEQYGMRMRLRARSVKPKEIPEGRFNIPDGYEQMDYLGMRSHMENLLGQFLNKEEVDSTTIPVDAGHGTIQQGK